MPSSHFLVIVTDKPDSVANSADFERALAELEHIVEKLERGDLSLDESLKQFERGVQLTRLCQQSLQQAEQKVEILLRKDGELAPAPFEPERDDDEA